MFPIFLVIKTSYIVYEWTQYKRVITLMHYYTVNVTQIYENKQEE